MMYPPHIFPPFKPCRVTVRADHPEPAKFEAMKEREVRFYERARSQREKALSLHAGDVGLEADDPSVPVAYLTGKKVRFGGQPGQCVCVCVSMSPKLRSVPHGKEKCILVGSAVASACLRLRMRNA